MFYRFLQIFFGTKTRVFMAVLRHLSSKYEPSQDLRVKITQLLTPHPPLLADYNMFFPEAAPPTRYSQ